MHTLIHEFIQLFPFERSPRRAEGYALNAPASDTLEYAVVNIRMQSKIIGDNEEAGPRMISAHANLILTQGGALVAVDRGLLHRE